MPLNTATLASRYTMLPNQRVVTLTPQAPAATPISSINGTVRRPWNRQELQQFAVGIEAEKAAFLMPKATLDAAAGNTTTVPKNGWQITDDENNTWTIQSVSRELEGTMYRLPCILNV